jgi:hypothetical protein
MSTVQYKVADKRGWREYVFKTQMIGENTFEIAIDGITVGQVSPRSPSLPVSEVSDVTGTLSLKIGPPLGLAIVFSGTFRAPVMQLTIQQTELVVGFSN